MTRPNNWYPIGLYRFMLNMSTDNKLAIDEVAFNLLREALAEHGFVCDHSNIGYSKNDQQARSKPYCRSCYSRLEKIVEKRIFRGKIITEQEYRPKETFIDIQRKERAQKAKAEFELRVKAEVETRLSDMADLLSNDGAKVDDRDGKDVDREVPSV